MTINQIVEDYDKYISDLINIGEKETADKIKFLLMLIKCMEMNTNSMNKIIKRLKKYKT